MPTISDEIFEQPGEGSVFVVPLICAFSEGAMSRAAKEAFCRLAKDAAARAVLHCAGDGRAGITPELIVAECRKTLTADFKKNLLPLRLRQNLPLWIGLWLDGAGDPREFVNKLRDLLEEERLLSDAQIAVYAETIPNFSTFAGDEITRAKHRNTLWFISSPNSVLKYEPAVVGRASLAHLFTSWQKCCEIGTACAEDLLCQKRDAKNDDCRAYDLGIGYDAPDLDFQKKQLGALVYPELVKQWLSSASDVSPPEFPGLANVANDILDKTPYVVAEKENNDVAFITADTDPALAGTVVLRMRPDAKQSALPHDTNRRRWPSQRGLSQEYETYLNLVPLPAAETQTADATHRVLKGLQKTWTNYFRPAGNAAGLRDRLVKQFKYAERYGAALTATTGRFAQVDESSERRLRETDRAVLGVPAPWGIVLRLAMIAVGVFWLSWGTFFWGSTGSSTLSPLSDELLQWIFYGGIAGLAMLAVAGGAKYHCAREFVRNCLSLIYDDILCRHLGRVCGLLRQRLRGLGGAFLSGISDIEKKLETLSDALSESRETLPAQLENKNSRIGVRAAEHLWAQHQKELLPAAHARALETLAALSPEKMLDPQAWISAGKNACEQVAGSILEEIDYFRWCELAGLDADFQKIIVEELLIDSERATTRDDVDDAKPIYIGPIDFVSKNELLLAQQNDERGSLLLRHPKLPWLIVVRPLPLLKTRFES